MPPKPLVDFSQIDLEQVLIDERAILDYLPHRHEMVQIDRIVALNPEERTTVGIREIRDDEFWVRGHIPGRPLFPGVLLIEASAQLSTVYYRKVVDGSTGRFFGFARIDKVRFRGTIVPGDVVVLVVQLTRIKEKTALFAAQAFVEGNLIFEAEIMGAIL